jgi:hypothetical protein
MARLLRPDSVRPHVDPRVGQLHELASRANATIAMRRIRMSHISTVGIRTDRLVNVRPVIRQRIRACEPTAKLSQSQYSAACITSISLRHDGLSFRALQPRP